MASIDYPLIIGLYLIIATGTIAVKSEQDIRSSVRKTLLTAFLWPIIACIWCFKLIPIWVIRQTWRLLVDAWNIMYNTATK